MSTVAPSDRPDLLIGNTAESRLNQVQCSALGVHIDVFAETVTAEHPIEIFKIVKNLLYSAFTSGGRAYDIAFPLHPQTHSPEAVSEMITRLLEALTAQVQAQKHTSDGDILQALAMTLAVRARMVDASPSSTLALVHELVEKAHHAAQQASSYQAARA